MKEVIHNKDNLSDKDITEVVIRVKALLINNDYILIGNESGVYQFLGGHLEKNETLIECLKREVLEETGIYLIDEEITGPIMKSIHLNKDYPIKGNNRKCEIYYYVVKTNKTPNLNNTNYTELELKNNFKIEKFKLNEAINKIRTNMPKDERNYAISPDMISALEEYFRLI